MAHVLPRKRVIIAPMAAPSTSLYEAVAALTRSLSGRTDLRTLLAGVADALRRIVHFDHIGLHTASSIYLRMQLAAAEAGKPLRLRINVPGFDAVCRMVEAGMGLGLIPDRAFEVVGRGMELCAVRLRDDWAHRELKIVVRDSSQLSATGRLVLDHLRAAKGREHAVP